MSNELVGSLLDAYRDAPTLESAEQALKALERGGHDSDLPIGDLYDELAELAAEEENFGLAVRAQRRAVELGCEMPTLGREMLGWYLMKDRRRGAGEAEFAALRREIGDDPQLLVTLGHARADAGDEKAALAAFDEALATARNSATARRSRGRDRSDVSLERRSAIRRTRTTDSHRVRSGMPCEARNSVLQWPGSPGRNREPR